MRFKEYINEASYMDGVLKRQGRKCPNCDSYNTEKSKTHTGLRQCKECHMLYDPSNKSRR